MTMQMKRVLLACLPAVVTCLDGYEFDVSTNQPLHIGFGQTDYFSGKISSVRIYNKALTDAEIRKLFSEKPR